MGGPVQEIKKETDKIQVVQIPPRYGAGELGTPYGWNYSPELFKPQYLVLDGEKVGPVSHPECHNTYHLYSPGGTQFLFAGQDFYGTLDQFAIQFKRDGQLKAGDFIRLAGQDLQVEKLETFPKQMWLSDGTTRYILEDGQRIRWEALDPFANVRSGEWQARAVFGDAGSIEDVISNNLTQTGNDRTAFWVVAEPGALASQWGSDSGAWFPLGVQIQFQNRAIFDDVRVQVLADKHFDFADGSAYDGYVIRLSLEGHSGPEMGFALMKTSDGSIVPLDAQGSEIYIPLSSSQQFLNNCDFIYQPAGSGGFVRLSGKGFYTEVDVMRGGAIMSALTLGEIDESKSTDRSVMYGFIYLRVWPDKNFMSDTEWFLYKTYGSRKTFQPANYGVTDRSGQALGNYYTGMVDLASGKWPLDVNPEFLKKQFDAYGANLLLGEGEAQSGRYHLSGGIQSGDFFFRLADILGAKGTSNTHTALIDIVDKTGKVISTIEVEPGTHQTFTDMKTGKPYYISVTQTAPGFTLNSKWAKFSVYSESISDRRIGYVNNDLNPFVWQVKEHANPFKPWDWNNFALGHAIGGSFQSAITNLYPNPATDHITISFDIGATYMTLGIYDEAGQRLGTAQQAGPTQARHYDATIDLRPFHLAAGVYFVGLEGVSFDGSRSKEHLLDAKKFIVRPQ